MGQMPLTERESDCCACRSGSASLGGGTLVPAARRVSIVMPVFNQLEYTRGCVESLQPDLAAGVELIIVDNGSQDGTREYLNTLQGVTVIHNEVNRGCAGGWNQGVKAGTREWIVVLNNDVLLGAGWLDALVQFAESSGCGVVTPAIREGALNYAFQDYATEFVARMKSVKRIGVANGICFMVARGVFDSVGLFDERFRIGQYEDADFFQRAKNAGFKLGTTGSAFIHHFGSITQKAIQKTAERQSYEAENRAYFRAKWHLSRPRRWCVRLKRYSHSLVWKTAERLRYGHSLHEKLIDGRVVFY